jgi:hypothetical protein
LNNLYYNNKSVESSTLFVCEIAVVNVKVLLYNMYILIKRGLLWTVIQSF